MIVIGAVALVLCALAVVAAVVSGRGVDVHLSGFGVDSTTSVLWVFAAGAVAMLLLMIALAAFRGAARRRRAERLELKHLRAESLREPAETVPVESTETSAGTSAGSTAADPDGPDGPDGPRHVDLSDDSDIERRYVPGRDGP